MIRLTGIIIRVLIDKKWQNLDIGDPRVTDEQVFDWLATLEPIAVKRTVMIALGRRVPPSRV